jgi:hypothetical protein
MGIGPPPSILVVMPMEVVSIQGQKKLTWSCLCESPFDLGGRFVPCLQDLKNFSPSMCDILDAQKQPSAYFATIAIDNKRFLDSLTLHKQRPFLFEPFPNGPPFKYAWYSVLYLKVRT